MITKEHINDFRYLKELLERPEVNSVNTIRTAYDKKVITCTFIFSKSQQTYIADLKENLEIS